MAITDEEGRELYHTNTFEPVDEDTLKQYLKDFLKGKQNVANNG